MNCCLLSKISIYRNLSIKDQVRYKAVVQEGSAVNTVTSLLNREAASPQAE